MKLQIPTFDEILATHERLRKYLAPTPLRNYPVLDELAGLRILVKHENHHPTNSFKIRNALAAMTALSPEEKSRGVIAATRGNHGAGIAWAGKILDIPAVIVVPLYNNAEKNAAIKGYGAELIEEGERYDDAIAAMHRIAKERSLTPIHSTNNPAVLAGAATMSVEIFQQAEAMGESIDAMFFSVGGGSQAAGAVLVAKNFPKKPAIYGIQTAAAPAIHDSFYAKSPLHKTAGPTIADGVATGSTYEMTWDTLQSGITDFTTVTEPEIFHAIRTIIRTTHQLVEGAGAVGLAGLLKLAPTLQRKTVVVALSGSNIDQATLTRVMSHEM